MDQSDQQANDTAEPNVESERGAAFDRSRLASFDAHGGRRGGHQLFREEQPESGRRADWRLAIAFVVLCAVMIACLASGCGTIGEPNYLERTEQALQLLQCVEKVLPPADSNAAKPRPGSSSPAAAQPSVAADSGMPRGIDTADPWWVPDGGVK